MPGFQDSYVNIMAVDDLIPFVGKPSASMLLTYAEWQGFSIFC